MQRTTIVLPEGLKERAIERSRADGVSFGEFVRRAVERQLSGPAVSKSRKVADPFWDNLKSYDDRLPTDVAENHDDYLYGGSS